MKSDKDVIFWPGVEIKTPPISVNARIEVGYLIRKLQKGEVLSLPQSRPMPSIGSRCHELRVRDPEEGKSWRVIYRIDDDAIIVVEIFPKKSNQTPQPVIKRCQNRLKDYDS